MLLSSSSSSHSSSTTPPLAMDTFTNPWGSFFDPPRHDDHRYDSPDPPLSHPDLDQQVSQRLLRQEATSSDAQIFSPAQDVSISPAALFLAAFTPPVQSQPTHLPDDEGESVAGYILGPIIGHGGFSTIRRAFSPSGGVVAIKIVRRSDVERQTDPSSARKRLDHETNIWSSLSHEHILPLFSTQHSSYADFYVTLFCPAGSLFDILKRDGSPALPHDDAGMMFRQVVRGVRYLHEVAGYVHRDIKLENVLVDEMGVCRIADFGLTRKIGEFDDVDPPVDDHDNPAVRRHRSTMHHTVRQPRASLHPHASIFRHNPRRHRTSTPVGDNPHAVHPSHAFQPGSLPYAAPELLSPQTPSMHHGANPAQDMWALGCLLYALLTGRLPFSDPFEPRLTMKILHGAYEMPCNIGRGATRVLKGCLERDVRHRSTIAMVDEIAWDIGLGEADEPSSVLHPDKFEFPDCRSQPPASTGRRLRSDSTSFDRPSSRPRRSLSRTSITSSSSLSTRSTSRSVSRPPVTRLPLTAACDDVEHTSTPLDISAAAPMSPTFPIERGRRPKKTDARWDNRCAPSIGASTARSDLGFEPPRGRPLYAGTDVLDNTARWASTLGLNTIAEVTTRLHGTSSPAAEKLRRIQHTLRSGNKTKRSQRAESTPPVSSGWLPRRARAIVKEDSSLRLGESACTGGLFLREPSATPIPIAGKNGTRSRSVGYEPNRIARQLF